jgi:HSP90 family molecular chaperone
LLDIVTHSIYTDKEVFLRELISNASDALEKFRYYHATGTIQSPANTPTHPLEIQIFTNPTENTLTIVDNGIGMSRDELISNLGTIARSGSKQFVEQLSKGDAPSSASKEGIIGQFGVGFYSSFMVAESVSVESVSAQSQTGSHKWSSDGSGVFKMETVSSIDSVPLHGSKITMKLRESCKEFSDPERIKGIIKHYSNFVSFPIKVDGEVVNTVQAIWLQDKKEVSKDQYAAFYKFVANAGYDEPRYTLHFRTDAPIDLKCILFVPTFHSEKFGMGVMEPGVNLYSRKILIENKPKDLLPDWLRFLKGVVDSEDLPLSLSREKPQDSNLLRRIRYARPRSLSLLSSSRLPPRQRCLDPQVPQILGGRA